MLLNDLAPNEIVKWWNTSYEFRVTSWKFKSTSWNSKVLFPQESRKRMVSTFLMVAPHVRDSLEDKSVLFFSKKGSPRLFILAKKKIYLGAHLKEELTDLFWTVPGYSYSHKQRRKTMENTLLMVNIIPICKRYLEGKSQYSFFLFLSNSRKKIEPGLCLQQEENMLALNLQVFLLTNRQKTTHW